MHLKPDELVDLAEGAGAESSVRHLASCEACRTELQTLKTAMALAADVDVPEPSPLFWDHLSRRVSDAVAAAGSPKPVWWSWLKPAAAGACAAIIIALAVNVRDARIRHDTAAPTASTAVVSEAMPDPQLDDTDPSLVLVAELTSEMDLDGATEAGLAPQGSAEHAVTHMDRAELRELRQLLKEALANSGA
jgi:hypothetical protein